MTIIVDTNILVSACISTNNKISEIILDPFPSLKLISCYYAFAELFKHQEKIVKLAKQPADQVSIILYTLLRQIEFYNESIIQEDYWAKADQLTAGVDAKDISFVALALQKAGTLWTGDKKLTNHLKAEGFNQVINTTELYEILGTRQ
jgi:predicted nucleic acid-binding protein